MSEAYRRCQAHVKDIFGSPPRADDAGGVLWSVISLKKVKQHLHLGVRSIIFVLPNDMTITIRQLAKEVGLSPTTVSMVLNSRPQALTIPEETKRRVRSAARKFGYSPNPFARSLFSKRSTSVAILLSDITDPYCATVMKGISSSLHSSNYLPVLLDIDNSRVKFRQDLQKIMTRRIEGIIGVANSFLLRTELLETVEKQQIPIVLIGRDMEGTGISSVAVENEEGAFLAMSHLYELGHRAIGFLKGPPNIVDSTKRWKGVVKFAREAGLEISPKLTVQLKAQSDGPEAGFDATQVLIGRMQPFSALLAFDDVAAFGAIRALTQAGRLVPSDCSVIGFDDVSTATIYNPPLTTIRQPMEVLGSSAVEIFLELAAAFFDKKTISPIHRKIRPKLVIRESTQPLQR
jgi:DNA-binding LacI/PurR family transcriptional regulator